MIDGGNEKPRPLNYFYLLICFYNIMVMFYMVVSIHRVLYIVAGFSFDTSDMLEETCAFHMRLSSLAAVILHEDLLTLGLDTCELTPSSVSSMRNLSEEFFSQLGKFAVSGNKDFEASKEAFLRSCKHNHIRYFIQASHYYLDNRNTLSIS